jgi:hypothetical protein
MYVEEISLSAVVDDPEAGQALEEQKTAAVLEQTSWLRRCQSEFTLFNNHRLSVKTQGFMQNGRDYTVDIGILDPQPRRSLKICWSNLLIFVAFCGAALSFTLAGLAPDSTLLPLVLGAGAGLSLILAVYRSHDRLVFYSQYGRVPLVVLFNRLPDRATLDSFTDTLVQHIKDAKARYPCASETLSEELKAHRRLMEEGAISRKRYDLVKQRILSQHGHAGR